jgi:hypothetical protein
MTRMQVSEFIVDGYVRTCLTFFFFLLLTIILITIDIFPSHKIYQR